MRKAVITGLGIVSCIGNNKRDVVKSLRTGSSGITFSDEFAEMGFRSQVWGKPEIEIANYIDRRDRRFMGEGAAYNYIAMQQAIQDSGLNETSVSNERTGLIMGSGGPSVINLIETSDTARNRGPRKVSPFMVPRTMSSTNSATLATPFKIKGVNYSITSACSTSAHCIGNAAEMIQWDKQDIVFAGGGEELGWGMSVMFDAMPALSSGYNDNPTVASRAFDAKRDGFVIGAGGGVVVVEEYDHAKARGAKIYAEVVGYGATSDGYDMVQPSGEGAIRCMQQAMANLKCPVDYINTHGTSTPVGDVKELGALRETFKDYEDIPHFNSTKSLTGHSLGATGVQEAIYSLLMMENNFICASANIEELEPEVGEMPIVRDLMDNVEINCAMSNSFGFGGTNACLVFAKPSEE